MLWVGYTDNPQWRDVMWYHYHMWDRGDHWEGSIHGKVPDGIIVEVSDIAQGIPGYVSPMGDALLVLRATSSSLSPGLM